MTVRPMIGLRCAALAVGLAVAIATTAPAVLAAEVPTRYVGAWSGEEACRLVKSEKDAEEFPYLVVTRSGYDAHETSCRIVTAAKGRAPNTDVLTFACSHAGQQSSFEETWSISEKHKRMWGRRLTEAFLVRKGGEYGTRTYAKCAFSAGPR